MLKIGDGGCRGTDWSKKGCPKFVGRVKPGLCAKECRKHSYCTAFHILKHDPKDNTYECYLFAHKDVTAVKALEGECYTFTEKEEPEEEIKLGMTCFLE